MKSTKSNKKSIPDKLAERIEQEMIFGYKDENQIKQYPTLKSSAEWHDVSYDVLRQLARRWNWRQKRKDHKKKVSQKVKEKRKSEEISESEAEEIIVDDFKFNRSANKLRREADKQLELLGKGEVVLKVLEDGTLITGRPSNAPYQLMNIGKALESAQKVSKIAAGEPNEISKKQIDGTINSEPIDEFNKIMDNALEKAKDSSEPCE